MIFTDEQEPFHAPHGVQGVQYQCATSAPNPQLATGNWQLATGHSVQGVQFRSGAAPGQWHYVSGSDHLMDIFSS